MLKQIFGICSLFLMLVSAAITSQAATITVVNKNNSGTGSLRQAVLDANAGDTIDFAPNVRGTILLTGFEIELRKAINTNLTINGPGANVLGIESNFAFRIFRVQLGNIKISGLRISRGDGGSSFGGGGGIWVVEGANLTLENCLITGNEGGGIATMSDSTLTINNSMITGNEDGGIFGAGTLNMSNSTVSGNFGDDGAGIRWLNGTVTLTNVTVSGNEGIDSGGITIIEAATTIMNCTIAGNQGGNGVARHTGGLRIELGTINLKNTIIADNAAFTPDVGGAVVSQGNNLIGDPTGGSGFVASDLLNVNPRLGGFANNGGTTYTHSLLSISPAINAGINTGAPATDQRGVARPQGGTVDIGAYESGVRPAAFGKIVFVSNRDGNEEIYSMNVDGTNQTRLTNNSAFDKEPDWSPDGSKIGFSTTLVGNSEIYAMNANGSGLANLTSTAAYEFDPAWSPDGTKIAYSRTTSIITNDYELWVMDSNGANQTQLTNTSGEARNPSWSPDGTRIVFTSFPGGMNSIDIMNADGTNRSQLTVGDGAGVNLPAWSPDGNAIAYNNDILGQYIYLANSFDTVASPLRPLSATNNPLADAPAWSPDGAKLAFYRSSTGGGLYIIDADGTNPTLLIPVTPGVFNEFPDWFGFNTPIGANVLTESGTVTTTFSNVSTPGTTTVVPIDPTTGGTLPGGYSFGAGYPAYEITTTATYTAPITVCLQVPSTTTLAVFNALTLFHGENGVLEPRTSSKDFFTKTICASVTSLSPFVVAQSLAPTAANVAVGGRVLTAGGRGISQARVSITSLNGETRFALTNPFGFYRFEEVPSGETYVVTVAHKRYQFSNNPQVLTVLQETTNVDFTAEP